MKTIGIVIPTTDNSFFAGLVDYLEKKLYSAGYASWICPCGNRKEKEEAYYRELYASGGSGIMCVSTQSLPSNELRKKDIPLVLIDRVPEEGTQIPFVTNDDEAAIEEAARYLIEKGCRNILLAPGYIPENSESPRLKGYKKALEDNGITYVPGYVLIRKGEKPSEVETEALVRVLLQEGRQVDGLITSSDRSAFGAIAALRSIGYYVPEDVKLISFDNSPYATLMTPGITALDRNIPAMAECAARILLKRIQGESVSMKNIIPFSLIYRDSTR